MKLESAQLLSEWNQMTGNCSKSGEGQNCILFHELYLQPFSVKMTIFWFFKVNHKGNRKEKKTNKPELGKQIPEQCEWVPVSAGIVIRAKERHTVRVFASPQPTGKLVLYTQQLQTPPRSVGPLMYVHSQRSSVFPVLRQVFQPREHAHGTFPNIYVKSLTCLK